MTPHPMLTHPLCRLWIDFQTVRHLANLRVNPVACPEIAHEAYAVLAEACDRLPAPVRWLAERTAWPEHR